MTRQFTRFSETFTVDDALEAIGFGVFQWKISLVTGLAWVKTSKQNPEAAFLGRPPNVARVVHGCGSGRRCHGDDDPQHPGTPAALRVEAPRLPSGPHNIRKNL